MPYIGKTPLTGAYQLCDAITTSATATYNLTVGSSPVIPGAAQNCIVSLNGVIQAPVSAYTVSGSTIVFASTLSATDVIDFILILGNVFDIGKPTDGSVTNASVSASAAIALSKLATTGTMTFASTIGVGGATPAASGAGITFPASASASTNANTLDDYEEGTWTPVLTFGGNAVGLTYGQQVGFYTKIGNSITVQYNIFLTNKGSSSGNNQISGLPFTTFNDTQRRISAYQFNDRITPNQVLTEFNSTHFNLQTLSSGTGSSAALLTNTDFVNNTYISGVFTYLV